MKIQLAYTPDPDDAFMLCGLRSGEVAAEGLEFEYVEAALPTLNDRASRGQYDVTMLSAAAYALVHRRYALLPTGATFGLDCGPVVVAREELAESDLGGQVVAIPGATTTAYTMLQLYRPTLRTRILPFDKLLPAVEAGLVDAALVIHEEFVTYRQWGLEVVVDLGKWWHGRYEGLPMPVTCCAVRNDLPAQLQSRIADLLGQSIRWAMEHRREAIDASMSYSGSADRPAIERFVSQYVNELSLEVGERGRAALERFYAEAVAAGLLPDPLPLKLVDGAEVKSP